MTIKTHKFRMLLPFLKKIGLCNHYPGITPYNRAAFYYSVSLSVTKFSSHLAEREAVKEVPRIQTTKEVLRKWGCYDIKNIFQRHPSLRKAVATEVESKLNSLSELGVTSSDLVNIICTRPRVISSNQNFNERLLVKAICRNPSFLVYDLREDVEPVFTLYEEMGISRADLVSMILLRSNLIPLTKMCEEKLEYIRKTGVTKESKMFQYVVTIIGVSRIATIREKIAKFEKFGISKDEVFKLFGRAPVLMTHSVDKIQRNMTFVIDTMKLPASIVLGYPYLYWLSANVDKMKPRVLLAGKMQEMGLEPQIEGPRMVKALRVTDERFVKKFVECHEKEVAEQLLAYYNASKRSAVSSKKFPHTWGCPFKKRV